VKELNSRLSVIAPSLVSMNSMALLNHAVMLVILLLILVQFVTFAYTYKRETGMFIRTSKGWRVMH
jgi:hypothetical protein